MKKVVVTYWKDYLGITWADCESFLATLAILFFNRNSKQCLKSTSELRNSKAEKNFLYSGLKKKSTCNIVCK